MSKKVKMSVVTPEVFTEDEFSDPASYFIVDCMGNRNYFHCRGRKEAQEAADEEYGKGKYVIKTTKMIKSGNEATAVGRINSRSRQGSRPISN